MKGTHSKKKKRPLVSRMSPRVRGKTPLCRAAMMRPPQQKRFFPGKTSHLLLGLLGSSPPSYSQLSMLEFSRVPIRASGASAQHPPDLRVTAPAWPWRGEETRILLQRAGSWK